MGWGWDLTLAAGVPGVGFSGGGHDECNGGFEIGREVVSWGIFCRRSLPGEINGLRGPLSDHRDGGVAEPWGLSPPCSPLTPSGRLTSLRVATASC